MKLKPQNKLHVSKNECLLFIVDVQEKLCAALNQDWLNQTISQIGLITLFSRLEKIPVVLTEQYPQGLGPTKKEVLKHLEGTGFSHYSKLSFGCVGDKAILQDLQKNHRDKKIILTGMETHICVTLTALGLLANGFEVFVAHDAVIARSQANHENSLSLITQAGGVVTNTETLVFQMMGCSGGDTFKAVSNYMKGQKRQ